MDCRRGASARYCSIGHRRRASDMRPSPFVYGAADLPPWQRRCTRRPQGITQIFGDKIWCSLNGLANHRGKSASDRSHPASGSYGYTSKRKLRTCHVSASSQIRRLPADCQGPEQNYHHHTPAGRNAKGFSAISSGHCYEATSNVTDCAEQISSAGLVFSHNTCSAAPTDVSLTCLKLKFLVRQTCMR
jgi:hypothetical protein